MGIKYNWEWIKGPLSFFILTQCLYNYETNGENGSRNKSYIIQVFIYFIVSSSLLVKMKKKNYKIKGKREREKPRRRSGNITNLDIHWMEKYVI